MTWTVKNVGTATWTTNYYVTFFGGDRIGNGPNSYQLIKEIKPNNLGSITVAMKTPGRMGDYKSIWFLMNDQKKAILELNVLISVK
jgi:molybdenum-dependent DNA-binding transcriptional regulator ModE